MRLARIVLPLGGLLVLATWTMLEAAAPAVQGGLTTFQPGSVARAQDVNDNFTFVVNEIAAVQASIANLDLQGSLQMQPTGTDGDQSIFFADGGSPTANYLRWEDASSLSCSLGQVGAGFVLNIADNFDTGWMFRNGTDNELVVDEMGFVSIDQTLTSNGSCDLAETFVGPVGAELEPGTVVVLDPHVPEGVLPASRDRDPNVVGVVTSTPGVLLNGPTAAALPWARELADLRRRSAEDPARADPQRAGELEELLDAFPRGDVPVALVGRVLVRVDVSRGAIRAGDVLTTSSAPGRAMRLEGGGPGFAIALDDCGAGCDEVLALLRPQVPADDETVAGTAFAPAGSAAVVVRDPRLRVDSSPHVTFHADPGARHWVSGRGAGWFELAFSRAPTADVPFGWIAR